MKNEIEEGCLAVVINGVQNPMYPTNIGKIVRVGKKLSEKDCLGDNIWEVNKPQITAMGMITYRQSERNLQRLPENDELISSTRSNKIKEPDLA